MGEERAAGLEAVSQHYMTFEQMSTDYGDGKTSVYYKRTDHTLDHMNPIVVLGTGRSGTSGICGMLSKLGVYPGRRIQPPDRFNPEGYYEDLEFAVLHDSLVATWMSNKTWKECMKGLIQHRQRYCKQVNSRWFFKDVRTLNFWELYTQVFKELDIVPKIIYCARDPEEVRKSMKKTAEYTSDAMIKAIVDQRLNIANNVLKHYEYLRVWWPDVLSTPRTVAQYLSWFLDLQAADVQIDAAAETIKKKDG
jgi:hypothetical protein